MRRIVCGAGEIGKWCPDGGYGANGVHKRRNGENGGETEKTLDRAERTPGCLRRAKRGRVRVRAGDRQHFWLLLLLAISGSHSHPSPVLGPARRQRECRG